MELTTVLPIYMLYFVKYILYRRVWKFVDIKEIYTLCIISFNNKLFGGNFIYLDLNFM